MTPFKCPACDGYGRRARKPGGKRKKCRACQGSCVVWSLDTYRPAPHYWHSPYWYLIDSLSHGTTGDVRYGNDTTVTAYNGDLASATWTVS